MENEIAPAESRSIGRSAMHLISGTVVSQAIQFGASLLLARLFLPAEFGQFASALGVATVLGVLIVLSYPSSIPLAATEEEARTLSWVSLFLALTLSTPVLLFLTTLAFAGSPVFGLTIGYWYAVFVPLAAVAVAAFSTLQMKLSRHGEFRRIGRATALGALVQATIQLGMGYLGLGAVGLALGYLLGRLCNVTFMLTKSRLGRPPGPRALRNAARSWSSRTRWLLLTTTMNMLGTSALTPWVHLQYGPQVAGSFAFALLSLSVPAALVGQAISIILYPRLAAAKRAEALDPQQVATYVVGLASISFPVFLPILILGSGLFQTVYGEEWRTAGAIAMLLAPVFAVGLVSSPISSVVLVVGKYKHTTVIATADTFLRMGAIALGSSLGSVALGFALYSLVGVAFYVSYIAWIMQLVGGSLKSVVVSNWKACFAASLATFALLAMRPIVPYVLLITITAMVSSIAFWGAGRRLANR